MMKIKIKQATTAVLDQLIPLFDAYRIFYEEESNPAAARQYLETRLNQNEAIVFIAVNPEYEQNTYGFTLLYPSFSSLSMKPIWILHDLFVTPTARRQGVAKQLMEHTHQFAHKSGAEYVALETAVNNHPAQKLYESLNYQRDTEFHSYYLTL